MLRKITCGTLVGFLLGVSGALAEPLSPRTAASQPRHQEMESAPTTSQFRRIEQPITNKIVVAVGGIGLIGLELWWFLLSKPKL